LTLHFIGIAPNLAKHACARLVETLFAWKRGWVAFSSIATFYAAVHNPDLDIHLCNDKPYVLGYSENNLVGFFPNHWIRLHFVQNKTVALSSAQSKSKKVARAVLSWASPLANVSFPQ
jgi:hypothetical protein